MPFLRVIRDKRGYETTYLLHWYRDGLRQRSRILYVFRTPGGARVGREPLDSERLRQLEAQYPDIEFDWAAMREHRQVIETAPEAMRRRRPRRDEPSEPAAESVPAQLATEPAAAPAEERPVAAAVVPAAIEGTTPDEQLAFLRHWYPLVVERIPRRMADPLRQEALFTLAAQLNPDNWGDAAEQGAGLAQAAEALHRLSRILARRRRRTRRRAPDQTGEDGAARTSVDSQAEQDQPTPDEGDDESDQRDGST